MIIVGHRDSKGKAWVILQPTVGDMPQNPSLLEPNSLKSVPIINGVPAFDWGQHCPGANITLAAALLRFAMDDVEAVFYSEDFVRSVVLNFHPLGWSLWPETIGRFARYVKDLRNVSSADLDMEDRTR